MQDLAQSLLTDFVCGVVESYKNLRAASHDWTLDTVHCVLCTVYHAQCAAFSEMSWDFEKAP